MDVGFVFAWAEKEAIASCVKLMQRWGFIYVENLAWVKQNVNHKFVKEDYPYFWKSKCNLLIFRKVLLAFFFILFFFSFLVCSKNLIQ
jgi:N6-adenosine-specific RNA methylase IME4